MDLVRLPLIVLVVFIHVIPSEINPILFGETSIGGGIYLVISELVSHSLGRIAVPAFFFISGYFMFYKLMQWEKGLYVHNLKKKLQTLIIPYVLWNALYYGMIFAKVDIARRFGLPIYDYEIHSLEKSFFAHLVEPINYPLWYLRDLICMNLIFPLFYIAFRYLTGGAWGMMFFLLYLSPLELPLAGLSSTAIFFVGIGGYLGFYKVNILDLCYRYRYLALCVILGLLPPALIYNQEPFAEYLIKAYIPAGIICFFNLTVWLETNFKKLASWCRHLLSAVFFVYALHTMYIMNWVTAGLKRLNLNEGALLLVPYFLAPVVVIVVCYVIYIFVKKISPRFLALLTGGRG
ncbi:MAG: acyltransferase [Porphyromonadaceae bacterium]|nr:acyltransferase [Porphyromonadaceae bacterium]